MVRVIMCTKLAIVVWNCLLMLSGISILGAGLWLWLDTSTLFCTTLHQVLPPHTQQLLPVVSYVVMALGLVISLLAFFGCAAALRENTCLLATYVVLLLLVFVVQVVSLSFALARRQTLELKTKNHLKEEVYTMYGRSEEVTEEWDKLQNKWECCGANGPQDYKNSEWRNNTAATDSFVPASCCKKHSQPGDTPMLLIDENQCQVDGLLATTDHQVTSQALNMQGCFQTVLEYFRAKEWIAYAFVGVIGLVEVVAIILAGSLFCCIQFWTKEYDL